MTTPFTPRRLSLLCMLLWGYCSLQAQALYELHWASSSDPNFSGSAAASLTQTLDTVCSQLFLSVTDTATAPWNGTSPIIINPKDSAGSDMTDLSNSMSFHLRVRSLETVELAMLLRAADGTSAFRTDRIAQTVTGDTTTWTELTYTFDASTIGGFDSTDLRDVWFYLDYGVDNFAGNQFWVDYVVIGPKPRSDTHSDCSLLPPFEFPWVLHWADTLDQLTSGSGAAQLNQVVDTACSQLVISVDQLILDPHLPFKTLRFNPEDAFGNDISDISGNLTFYARVRSLEEVEFTVRLRGGDGSEEQRSEFITHIVPAGLGQWTDLVFDFSGANLGGFDPTDLRDIFTYLNREEANFPGNEFYFDYVSLGSPPDSSLNSACITTSIDDQASIEARIYPNPIVSGQSLQIDLADLGNHSPTFNLLTMTGQTILREVSPVGQSPHRYTLALPDLAPGLYVLKISSSLGTKLQKIMVTD